MKENILKISKLALLIIAVVVVCILLFKQCSGDKSGVKKSTGNSSAIINVKKETVEEAQKINSTESQKKRDEVISQGLVDDKEVVFDATKKVRIGTQVKNENEPIVQKEYRVSFSKQVDGGGEEEGKIKVEDVLKEELKVLTAKVDVLEENIKALLEKMRLFSEEKENRILAETRSVVEQKKDVDSTSTADLLKIDDVDFKYPTHVLAGGFSTYEKWTGYGLQASYTYRINKFISLGAQGNAFLKEGKYSGDRDLYMGIRANFHIFPLFVENSRFDLYAAGTAGFGRDDSVDKFETMWYLGSSYDFSKYWGVFVEAGNIGVFGLRLRF